MGIAWMYAQEAKTEVVGKKKLADAHPLAEQRYYNWLCLAYGAKPKLFADLVRDNYLTAERAETCQDEYRRAAYAVAKLMGPYLDVGLRDKVLAHISPRDRMRHRSRMASMPPSRISLLGRAAPGHV